MADNAGLLSAAKYRETRPVAAPEPRAELNALCVLADKRTHEMLDAVDPDPRSTELEGLYLLADMRSLEMAMLEADSLAQLSDERAYLTAMERKRGVPAAGALASLWSPSSHN